jgi:hypothetical protein
MLFQAFSLKNASGQQHPPIISTEQSLVTDH